MQTPKPPSECQHLGDIRQGIDFIDHQIVTLLQQRMEYVLSAAQFKPDLQSIPAPERVAAQLQDRRQWAEQANLSPDYIESLFNDMIQWFISQQTHHWRNKNGLSSESSK